MSLRLGYKASAEQFGPNESFLSFYVDIRACGERLKDTRESFYLMSSRCIAFCPVSRCIITKGASTLTIVI
jgi:hypothetical protein